MKPSLEMLVEKTELRGLLCGSNTAGLRPRPSFSHFLEQLAVLGVGFAAGYSARRAGLPDEIPGDNCHQRNDDPPRCGRNLTATHRFTSSRCIISKPLFAIHAEFPAAHVDSTCGSAC